MRPQWVRVSRLAAAAALAFGTAAAAAVAAHATDIGALRVQARADGQCVFVTGEVDQSGASLHSDSTEEGPCPENASPGDVITQMDVVDPQGVTRNGAGTLTGAHSTVVGQTTTVTRGEVPTYTTTYSTGKTKPKTAVKP
jgi:hypothetical protein